MNTHATRVHAIWSALAEAGAGSPAVTIGVVDGLPDLEHPLLRDASLAVMESMVPPDSGGADAHGTAICSLLFGTDEPVRGLAPGCKGLILPIFFAQKNGALRPVSQLDLARAISFALERDVSIINISAGQKSVTVETESHLDGVLRRAAESGALIVAAAGNDGCACIHLPAGVASVLSVGALDATGRPLEASNWAETYRRNGLLAPGDDLPIATPGGGVGRGTGTSYATAVVTGVAALLLSVAQRERYDIDPSDIRDILIDSAAPCTLPGDGACDRYLAGTLDAGAALALLHRAGRAARPTATPSAGEGKFSLTQRLEQSANSGMGSMVMSNLGSVESVAAVAAPAVEASAIAPSACSCQQKDKELEPSGVAPSACNCQQKEDEKLKAKVTPQGVGDAARQTPRMAVTQNAASTVGLTQQACSCGGGEPPQIAFAIGALWFDFGTEARYDVFVQQLDPIRANNPAELIGFLRENPQFASGITFILMQEQIPLYAVHPAGTFAPQIYNAVFDAVESSLDDARNREQRVSIPGIVSGTTRLLNGMTVPILYPDLRGMYKWQSHELIAAAKSAVGSSVASDDHIFNFLNRVYYELRNFGLAPQERALNFAATNAFQSQTAFAESAGRNLELDTIKVVKSPICRPDSDCWDVELQMFDPENERRANRVYRFTVDVSEILPVTVGSVRTWAVRA